MSASDRLRQLPGYLSFNAGVMFFIGLALALVSENAAVVLGADQLRLMGFAILLAVLAMAAGFASVARIEFARREGRKFQVAWIVPSVLVGLPLGRSVASGVIGEAVYILIATGMTAALAGLVWLSLRARQEIKA